MKIDSRSVNREIRAQIKPLLKDAGFSTFTSRTSWRYRTNRIDLINFQSFNSYLAGNLGCTSYSFAINLGCYLTYVPYELGADRIKVKNGKLLPLEFNCPLPFRMCLTKKISQPEFPRENIWYVDPRGEYLRSAVFDAAQVISRDAFSWFERFSNDEEVMQMLRADTPSPMNSYLIGYCGLFLRRFDLSAVHLRRALDSGCFNHARAQIEEDLIRATSSGK